MAERALLRFVQDAEDVASGLQVFRDRLAPSAPRITLIISQLFAVSSVLRAIDHAQLDPRNQPSLYRIRDDVGLVLPSLRSSLDAAFDMFARSRQRSHQMVWDDLQYRMDAEESLGFLERLQCYKSILHANFDTLLGRRPPDIRELRRGMVLLLDAQHATGMRRDRRAIDSTTSSTPRPQRPPLSPSGFSDDWSTQRPPPVPDPPDPMSPTFTSSSSHTLSSSQTSYSSDTYLPPSSLVHWAAQIFDGQHPGTPFRPGFQLDDRCVCSGTADVASMQHLAADGFQRALQLPFDEEQLWMRFYWRPPDNRARILIMTKDVRGRDLHYSQPLTNLKVFRDKSCLQLCRARQGGQYTLWAKFNFLLYERMVLFYSTLVAMKRQDQHPIPAEALVDSFELEHRDGGEIELFGGQIADGNLLHALRLFKDRSSGVVRLEACALRGPMKDVPLWTAFVTRYAYDPAWAHLEGRGEVSLAALRPPPYVFLVGYQPPRNRNRDYVLPFTSVQDARQFIEAWTGLCRASTSS